MVNPTQKHDFIFWENGIGMDLTQGNVPLMSF